MKETRAKVSVMETHRDPSSPSADDLRAALHSADAEEDATRFTPVPVWYFPTLAALLLVLFSLNAWETGTPLRILHAILALILAATVGFLVWRISLNRPGYVGVKTPWAWGITVPSLLVALAIPVTATILADPVGEWVWIPSGMLMATLILGLGIPYQRKYARG